jgi:dihydroneopterin aldolase
MNEVPSSTVISIEGIRAQGRHGANPGEQLEAQEFVVDVEVWVEVQSDHLEGTLDYRAVADRVRRTVEERSFVLLESLAEAVASDLYELEPVLRASAIVHKPNAALSLGVADVSAEFTAES